MLTRRKLFGILIGSAAVTLSVPAFGAIDQQNVLDQIGNDIENVGRMCFFRKNNSATRRFAADAISKLLADYTKRGKIVDSLVVCNDKNNGMNVINSNKLNIDVGIKLSDKKEFIYTTMTVG